MQASAQNPESWDAGRLQLTRAELQLLLEKFDRTGNSAAYTGTFKLRAQSEAELVRERLRDGDFQVGDQVFISVAGEAAYAQGVTLNVGPNRVIVLPQFGDLSLAGVLRSELTDSVRAFVSRFVREPVVQTRALVRVAVMGAVAQPGFKMLPAESLISDAITAAGGPAGNAKLSAARVERGTERIWHGPVFQEAIADGRTLDQMSIRSGDQIIVPLDTGSGGARFLRTVTMLPALVVAVLGIINIL